MKLKRTILGPALVAAVAVASGGWLLQQGVAQQGNGFDKMRIFEEVVHYVSNRYVDEYSRPEVYQMAIEGLLHELDDPHTSFMSAEEYNNLRIQTTGEYGGLGIEIVEQDGWITILSVIPGTPADDAGLMAGDRIVRVEGEPTEGWTTDDAVKVLRGPKGEPVTIGIARLAVDEVIPFTVVRDEIELHPVPYAYMLSDGVGYVRLRVFSETAAEEVRRAIEQLNDQGMEQLILDLRDNPGGLLDQGIAVANLFLERGNPISETRSRDPQESQSFDAVAHGPYTEVPMAVLINGSSASASEIVAGALQDNDRALVLGTPSFGKGSVQTLLPLSGGNFLKITTGRWYTPVGRSIQRDRGRIEESGVLAEAEPVTEEAEPVTEEGTPLMVTEEGDTVARQAYHTVGGRTVYGGGGIVPDMTLEPDTLTTAEQEYFAAISKAASKYNDVVSRYAVDFVQAHPNLERDFPVTPEMRRELHQRMEAADIEVDAEAIEAAQQSIDRYLAYRISLAKWGRAAAEQRVDATDQVLRQAIELLAGASNQQALFRAAQAKVEASRS